MSDSLIQRAATQPELLKSSEMPDAFFENEEGSAGGYQFTGERLFAQHPEKYRWIVSLLAEKLAVHRVAKLVGVSVNTVCAVRDREPKSIETEKERIAAECYTGARLLAEGIVADASDPERLKKIATRDKAITLAVLVDKGQLLAGEATSRLEVTQASAPAHDDYNAYIASLKHAGTGLEGEKTAQKGPGILEVGATGRAAVDATGTADATATVDADSDGRTTEPTP